MLGIIFDKDGTLTDLQARWAPVFCGMVTGLADGDDGLARRLAASIDLDLDARRVAPHGLAAVGNPHEIAGRIREVMLASGDPPDALIERMAAAFRAAPEGRLVPLGEVATTMAELARRGVRLAVATADTRDNTLLELGRLGVADLVEELRCGDDRGPVKPDPEVLLGICRAWDLDVSQVTFVGDSHRDLRCARGAGMRFVAVGELGALGDGPDGPPDHAIADIGGLVPMLPPGR